MSLFLYVFCRFLTSALCLHAALSCLLCAQGLTLGSLLEVHNNMWKDSWIHADRIGLIEWLEKIEDHVCTCLFTLASCIVVTPMPDSISKLWHWKRQALHRFSHAGSRHAGSCGRCWGCWGSAADKLVWFSFSEVQWPLFSASLWIFHGTWYTKKGGLAGSTYQFRDGGS